MNTKTAWTILGLASLAFTTSAMAGTPVRVPEPATLGLLAIGLGAAAITRLKKRK